uniref:EamA family transporter n=1 Tax=uncultured Nocardioides sp. TaxID=198441 RepID=UPI00262CB4C0
MTTLTHDAPVSGPGASASRLSAGLTFALVSSLSFGLSGAVARGLLDTGWSPGAATLVRVSVAALVVLPLGLVALRGRWALLRSNATVVVLYGVLAVAGAQFCYFSAVQHMQVAPALLIEYTAPAAVVLWLWLRHGQRPGRITLAGAGVAAVGLVLVLDVVSGADLSLVGVAWALGAMVGATAYFLISADEGNGLPPLTLAAGGLVIGSASLALLGVLGLLPMRVATAEVTYAGPAGTTVAWWVPVLVLGLVTAGVAYTSGIAAGRRLGSRLASFVALTEVLAAVVAAWLLLGELPRAVQLLGGVLVLAGEGGRDLIARSLSERGAELRQLALYRRAPSAVTPDAAAAAISDCDAVVVTNGEALTRLYRLTPEAQRPCLLSRQLVVPSERVVEQALSLGFVEPARVPAQINDAQL